ncbi:hypothetical protein CTAYLR_006926 [Chrysophaeum taylorii]|uniref:RING-type E3 ubiquitin transferase n=1 Tax=Chrysophaeum taylorii TaxID=2483200 RepID=A0AAD7UA24_9STRA|nr:hypothetical protein CTAYLR_006926 [Chrysophaeum taylorii]
MIKDVVGAVPIIKKAYDLVKVLKKECKEARNIAESVGEIVGSIDEAKISGSLVSFHEALTEMLTVLEVCSTKRAQAVIFSKTYLGKLRAATSKIHDGLDLIGGNCVEVTIARDETQAMLESLPPMVRGAEELRAAIRCAEVDILVAKLQEHRLAEDEDEARWQLEEIQRDRDDLLREPNFVERALLDAVCGLAIYEQAEPPPAHFVCPITRAVMLDPVYLLTKNGRSYERAALEDHLYHSPRRDPLEDADEPYPLRYGPNYCLKAAIEQWRATDDGATSMVAPSPATLPRETYSESSSTFMSRTPPTTPDHVDAVAASGCCDRASSQVVLDDEALARLIGMLLPNDREREVAAESVWSLAVDNADNKIAIAKLGGIPPLVELVTSGTDVAKENAAAALWNLAANNPDNNAAIAKAGGILPLVDIATHGTVSAKPYAAAALGALAVSASNQVAIARAEGIPPLVEIAKNAASDDAKEMAAAALWNLAVNNAENKVAIARHGGIPPLVEIAKNGSDAAKATAAVALWNLAANNLDNKVAIARAQGIPPLVGIVSDGTDEAKAQAAGALWNLAVNAGNQAAIARAGGILPLVDLAMRGSDMAKQNAAAALMNLADNALNKVAIARAGGILPLIDIAKNGTDVAKKWAAGALMNLAANNPDNKLAISRAGGIPPLERLARSGATPKAREVARLALGSVKSTTGHQ